jgi:hypothetical protein
MQLSGPITFTRADLDGYGSDGRTGVCRTGPDVGIGATEIGGLALGSGSGRGLADSVIFALDSSAANQAA